MRVEPGLDEIYVAAFLARSETMRDRGQPSVDEPGLHGLLRSPVDRRVRLLVTDDRAYEVIAGLLPDARAGMISVFPAADRCAELIARQSAWRSDTVTAMICPDLRLVPMLSLTSRLRLRPVRRLREDPGDGVPLQDAVAAAIAASPAIDDPPEVFAEYLRSLPTAIRLFAAIDADGVVRATSGAGAYGTEASVLFVNTDPGWRRQGIGLAMTAAALRSARARGARRACLEASDAGASIYKRLGFEPVTQITRFFYRA